MMQKRQKSSCDLGSPQNKKNHVQALVSMLDEKNKYIKVLHRKVDKLNEIIQHFQSNKSVTAGGGVYY